MAIKTISRTILTPKLVDNLESEISILKQLKHKHITQLIDILKVERFIFLIMEDCTGGDLAGYLKRRGRVEGLQYILGPGQAPIYYPHPWSGGLDIVVVRSFLRQLGEPGTATSVDTCSPRSGGIECHGLWAGCVAPPFRSCDHCLLTPLLSARPQVPSAAEPHTSRYQTPEPPPHPSITI